MKREIHYLNTDLELVADQSLDDLVKALAARGLFPLHVDQRDDDRWSSTLETVEQFTQPEPNIVALLTAIEALDPQHCRLWAACTSRKFDIGYECGDQPWAFHHGLSVATLGRMAALDIALGITLYPAESPVSPAPETPPEAGIITGSAQP